MVFINKSKFNVSLIKILDLYNNTLNLKGTPENISLLLNLPGDVIGNPHI